MYEENKVLKYYKESHRDAAPLMESVMPSFLPETDGTFQAASVTDRTCSVLPAQVCFP